MSHTKASQGDVSSCSSSSHPNLANTRIRGDGQPCCSHTGRSDLLENNSFLMFDLFDNDGNFLFSPNIKGNGPSNLNITKNPCAYFSQRVDCETMLNEGNARYPIPKQMSHVSTPEILLAKMADPCQPLCHKVTVLGAGASAMAVVLTLLAQNITNEIVVFDTDEMKASAEILDLQIANVYLNNAKIYATCQLCDTIGSKVIIITSDYSNLSEDDDLSRESINKNISVLRDVVPHLVFGSPNSIIINGAFPYDVMTYVIYRLVRCVNDKFPVHRIVGLGTSISSARLKYLVGKYVGIATSSCRAMFIGETGSNSVPLWGGVSAGGVRIQDVNPQVGFEDDSEVWLEMGNHAMNIEQQIRCIKNKKPSCWAPGVILAQIAKAVLHNTQECFTLSTFIKGCRHAINKDVFMSLPCIIGSQGVHQIAKQPLGEWERDTLQTSAVYFHEMASKILPYPNSPSDT